MFPVKDGQVFKDQSGTRMIAYNCNLDGTRPNCLQVDSLTGATIYDFTLGRGDTNSPTSNDIGQPKVRTMVAPYAFDKLDGGMLPVKTPIFMEASFIVNENLPTYLKLDSWWFLPFQCQRVRDRTSTSPTSSPPFSVNIENINGGEYFKPVIWNMSGKVNGTGAVYPQTTAPVMMVRKKWINLRLDYFDDQGGPNGFAKCTVQTDGGAIKTLCDYKGETGFEFDLGNYIGFGEYGADGMDNRQLPLNFKFKDVRWGITQ